MDVGWVLVHRTSDVMRSECGMGLLRSASSVARDGGSGFLSGVVSTRSRILPSDFVETLPVPIVEFRWPANRVAAAKRSAQQTVHACFMLGSS